MSLSCCRDRVRIWSKKCWHFMHLSECFLFTVIRKLDSQCSVPTPISPSLWVIHRIFLPFIFLTSSLMTFYSITTHLPTPSGHILDIVTTQNHLCLGLRHYNDSLKHATEQIFLIWLPHTKLQGLFVYQYPWHFSATDYPSHLPSPPSTLNSIVYHSSLLVASWRNTLIKDIWVQMFF